MKFFTLITIFLFTQLAVAQGLILDDETYKATPLLEPKPERGTPPPAIDFRPYCPTAGDQLNQPSCVGWALANALTTQKAIDADETCPETINDHRYSVAYIYNQIKVQEDCNLGADPTRGLTLLKEKGDCYEKILPYIPAECHLIPNNQHHQLANQHRIVDYKRLFEKEATSLSKINMVIDILMEYRPVIVAMRVPADFRVNIPKLGAEWAADMGHVMVVVGYNELSESFLIMNSYGDWWGDRGFFWMDWETFGEQVRYGYVLVTEKN